MKRYNVNGPTVILHPGLNNNNGKRYNPNSPVVILHPGLNKNPTKLHKSFLR